MVWEEPKKTSFFVFLEYILTAMSRSNEILFALKIYSWAMFWIPTSWGLLFKKIFSGTLKIYKITKKRDSSPVWCSLQQLKIAIWTNLNQEKPDTAHVSDNKNRNTRRMIIIFVSVDSVDPKDICKYRGYVVQPSRKFFRATQSQSVDQILLPFS